jgi:catechol 2,3-dioxygenase-like lactoylglutathione lyase family enzyme
MAEPPPTEAHQAKTLTADDGRRIAANIARLPRTCWGKASATEQPRMSPAGGATIPAFGDITSFVVWTRHRILDHIGFDVNDHAAFVKKLETDGIKLDEPPRQATPASNKITYITDPWGTRIEIIERAPLMPVN